MAAGAIRGLEVKGVFFYAEILINLAVFSIVSTMSRYQGKK
ncbi:hypothetical protein RI844_14260 [Thalassotalea fonticola]|uniref:Uncharacterized protein n=1 Tax=Thalassotalea fonticola TaxID=3065649 RepID=A0ABZ0GLB5_9GAMM|nr:hypothetical protein RI844_14260 [Colwelliaceae bacterium S1-1]